MKIEIEYWIVMSLVVILIIVVLQKSTMIVPFREATHFSKTYDYEEGFTNPKEIREIKNGNKVDGFPGFYGLSDTPVKLDSFGKLAGNKGCSPTNLTNNNGYLCMDDTHDRLLRTRGGNDIGQAMEI
jgi:hypothetical protein